jgi:hypothetical protein
VSGANASDDRRASTEGIRLRGSVNGDSREPAETPVRARSPA